MSPQEYNNIFGNTKNELIASYESLEELEMASESADYYDAPLLKCRLRAFKQLKQSVVSLHQNITNHKVYVRRLDYIYDDHDRVCQFFGVDREFQCILDDEYGDMMTATVDQVSFSLPDGSLVTVTLQDLYNAFELGYNSIQEICRVKQKTGSVTSILLC